MTFPRSLFVRRRNIPDKIWKPKHPFRVK